MRHPDVTNAALVAMPDPVLGERICAYLILARRRRAADRRRRSASSCASRAWRSSSCPNGSRSSTSFPLTNVGKVSKKDLRGHRLKIEKECVAS